MYYLNYWFRFELLLVIGGGPLNGLDLNHV